jgi:hypothetical protein
MAFVPSTFNCLLLSFNDKELISGGVWRKEVKWYDTMLPMFWWSI